MIVYFDMDGVLSDLDGMLAKFANVPLSKIQDDPDFRLGVVKKSVGERSLMHWTSLPALHKDSWKSLMGELKGRGHDLNILTSYGSWDPLVVGPLAHLGKTMWLHNHYGDLFGDGTLSDFNGVEKCNQKRFFADTDSILIDDQEGNISSFRSRGGGSILYSQSSHEGCLRSIREAIL